jgi:nitrite reductase/ring-hydroxylating ferredoxin subunit
VRKTFGAPVLKGALSGIWLGHAVHPMLTDVVIGSFTSASLLDLLAPGGDGTASERLIAVGVAAYLPTAATGINDWADAESADDGVRRVGLVHAGCNAVVDETPVLLLRDGERIFANHDRCSHRGCSLADGKVEGDQIVCACHGSRFDRRDGSLRRGPATAAQPAFQVRERDGRVEIRRLQPA